MSDIKITTERAIHCLSTKGCYECEVKEVEYCWKIVYNMAVEALKGQKSMLNMIERYEKIIKNLGKKNDNLREENEALKAQFDKPELQSKIIVSLKSGKVVEVDNPDKTKICQIVDELENCKFIMFNNHTFAIDQIESIEVRE